MFGARMSETHQREGLALAERGWHDAKGVLVKVSPFTSGDNHATVRLPTLHR